ncbi:hypothetical protein ACJMK2_007217 [Sinanodonta woodiana]|uniref:Ig-like domain-containing protein n=1 Tax=Sinanodonta woodiana TaxID=1069815 RepID=A0ABD3VHU6_SINWO
MWHIYISFAVLFGGAFCNPIIQAVERSNCTVVIKHSDKQVTTLEVKWNSNIYLICDASCVGPRPRLDLTWFYRDKNQTKLIKIKKKKLPKIELFPKNSHWMNELVIRDFGPSEETDFICKGSYKKQRLEAKVTLIGTGTTDTGRTGSAVTRVDVEVKPTSPSPIRVQVDRTRIEVEEGQTARIVCTAVGSLREATYILSWSKLGAAMPNRAIEQNGVLIIPNIQVIDGGNFVCTGSDMFSNGSVIATIIVTASESVPSIRIEPRYQTVEEGSPVRFECIVTASPRAKVEWHRGDRPLSPEASVTQDGVFQLPRAKSSDKGVYFCKATNKVGTSDMRTILYVTKKETKPGITIIVRQISVVALIGSTARLECHVEDETGRVTLFWSRTGSLPPGSVQTDGVLTIPDIQPSYAGNYVCTGTTDTGRTGSAVTRLDIEVKPETEIPTVRVEPETITILMQTTGTLRCIVTGVPAHTVTWLRPQKNLASNHEIDGDILRITQASMEDEGIYICRAGNFAGSDQDWGMVKVERGTRPKIELYPEGNQTVYVEGSALFQCRVMDGDPPPKITWSRAEGLQLTERTEVMDNGVIMFKGTTQQEQGSYICTATNDMGTTTATATLIVQGPPRIMILPSKTIYASVGQRVRIECIAQEEPTSRVYWINPFISRRSGIAHCFVSDEGTSLLEIANVAKEDTGYYTCVAENVGGRTKDRVHLIVEEGQRAEVKIAGPGTLSVADGGSVELTCTASAILNPIIQWRRSEGPLPPDHSLRGGILSIPRLPVEYGGEYICSTSTPEGNYQASVFISVTGTELQTSKTSQQNKDGKYDVTEEQTKIIMVHVGINDDGDNGLLSTTDGVTDNTAEFTDTTQFDYDFYN